MTSMSYDRPEDVYDAIRKLERELEQLKAWANVTIPQGKINPGALGGILGPSKGGTGFAGNSQGIHLLINGSGGTVNQGDVVILNAGTAQQFTTSTTEGDTLVVGVADETIAPGAFGRVRIIGYQAIVNVTGVVSTGDYLIQSTTAGVAISAGADTVEGAFGIAQTASAGPGAGTISAFIFPPHPQGGGIGYTDVGILSDGQQHQWVDMPAAETELLGSANYRVTVPLFSTFRARILASVQAAGASTPAFLVLKYSLDAGMNWEYLDHVSGPFLEIDSTGDLVGDWVELDPTAQDDVLLAIFGEDGDATEDPIFTELHIQLEHSTGGVAVAGGADLVTALATYYGQGNGLPPKDNPDDPPDDEFDLGSLDPKWTAVSGSSGTVNLFETGTVSKFDAATKDGFLLLQVGPASGQIVELRQDYTLPDGASIILAVNPAIGDGGQSIANNELRIGLSINDDDAGWEHSEEDAIFLDVNTNAWRVLSFGAGSGIGHSASDVGPVPTGRVYFRIHRSGTTIFYFYSLDGAAWAPLGNRTRSATATNVWIFAVCQATQSTPVPITAIDWIRLGGAEVEPWAGASGVAGISGQPVVTYEASSAFNNELVRPQLANYSLETPPATPDALDDEFDDDSFDTGQWTVVNDPGGGDSPDEATYHGFLTVGLPELGTDDFANLVQIYQAAPTGTQTMEFIARVSLAIDEEYWASTDHGEFAGVGIALINSTDSEMIGSGGQIDSGDTLLPFLAFGFQELWNGVGSNSPLKLPQALMIWIRLRKTTASAYTSANTYKMDYSIDGINWVEHTSASKTFITACDRVGFVFRRPKVQGNTPHARAVLDCFRRTS